MSFEGLEPYCARCGETHPKARECERKFGGDCSECVLKNRRILELEAKLEKRLSGRRGYQREYMRKRRGG